MNFVTDTFVTYICVMETTHRTISLYTINLDRLIFQQTPKKFEIHFKQAKYFSNMFTHSLERMEKIDKYRIAHPWLGRPPRITFDPRFNFDPAILRGKIYRHLPWNKCDFYLSPLRVAESNALVILNFGVGPSAPFVISATLNHAPSTMAFA